MHIECPHCKNPIGIVADPNKTASDICPSCGSKLSDFDTTAGFQGELLLKRIGRFDLIEVIGHGQFGTVWKARDTRIERIIALKLPRRDDTENTTRSLFLREARAAANVSHPNIVTILDVDEIDGQIFIASEFINGVTLREKLKQGRMEFGNCVRLLANVADAVHQAHESGITHRDLKPANILIDAEGTPFVADFGLAKQNSAEITLTVKGMILGTPAYMSPEQARGDSHLADRRSDVYSLGVIFYEMLTGKKPFDGPLLLHQIQSSDPRAPRSVQNDIPLDLETVCLKAMDRKPSRRYQTAAEFNKELNRFLEGRPVHARRRGFAEKAWKTIRKNIGIVCTSAIGICLAFILFWNLSSNNIPAQPKELEPLFTPLAWPVRNPSDFYKFAPDSPTVIKSTACYSCLQSTQPSAEKYRVSVEAILQGDSSAGVAFGIHELNVNPKEYQMLIAYVAPESEKKGMWLWIELSNVMGSQAGNQPIRGQKRIARVMVNPEASPRVNLSVEVENDSVTDILYNRQSVLDLVNLSNVAITPKGRTGIVARNHVVFSKFSIEALK